MLSPGIQESSSSTRAFIIGVQLVVSRYGPRRVTQAPSPTALIMMAPAAALAVASPSHWQVVAHDSHDERTRASIKPPTPSPARAARTQAHGSDSDFVSAGDDCRRSGLTNAAAGPGPAGQPADADH